MAELSQKTLGTLFDETSAARADSVFLVFEGRHYTYKEVHDLSDKIAKGLLSLGIKKGDHVAIWMGNDPLWVVFQQAVYKIGAVLVTINTHNLVDETEYLIGQSDSVAVIVQQNFLNCDFVGMLNEMAPELAASAPGRLHAQRLPKLRTVIAVGGDPLPGTFSLDDVVSAGEGVGDDELAAAAAEADPEDVALIIYTSGTTGRPKGAMITHKAIIARMEAFAEWFEFVEDDSTLFSLPLFYIFGAVIAIEGTIVAGSKLCILERFDSKKALQTIEEERCTIIHGVPTVFYGLLQDPDFDSYDLSSGRTGVMGGAPSPLALTKEIASKIIPQVCSVWGLTESSTMVTSTHLGDPLELVSTSVGVALPGSEVVIVDPQTGDALPNGEEGEVCVNSPYNMVGYYNNPEGTAEAIDARGYLHTGDNGVVSPETGCLSIIGRLKDMLLVGGSNVYPAEIENEICSCAGVSQAQVVGIPDDRLGERPVAFVQTEAGAQVTEEDIKAHCARHLAKYKVPVSVYFVDEYPLTVSGKVQKFRLREMAAENN